MVLQSSHPSVIVFLTKKSKMGIPLIKKINSLLKMKKLSVERKLRDKVQIAIKKYKKDGVAVIPGVFTKQEADNLRAQALVTLTKLSEPNKYSKGHVELELKQNDKIDFPVLLFWPALRNKYLNDIRSDSRLQFIVSSFLGPSVKQLNNQIYFRMPGDGDSFHWHQDVIFRIPKEDYPGIEESYLQTIVVIDEITKNNGAVEYILGSQKKGNLQLTDKKFKNLREFDIKAIKKIFPDKNPVAFTAKPGDVVVWSVMIAHGSRPNNSNNMRMTYMNGFAKADAAKKWPFFLKNGSIQKLNPKLIP